MPTSRREFLGNTAAAAAASWMRPAWSEPPKGAPQATRGGAGWYDRPMRWAQVGFAEDDPGNYDPQFWLDYFKRLHVDAVTLNAGGAVAF